MTWGHPYQGGDSSSVSSQLSSGVTEIFSTNVAFAALKSDGSVVTWGGSTSCPGYCGGDSSSVSSQISSGVTEIFSAKYAFAALKSDGSVVTWGDSSNGGDSSSIALSLSSGVSEIFSSERAFAALKSDGSVVTWGHSDYGGDSNSVTSSLSSGVQNVYSSSKAFAALDSDGANVPADGTACDDGDSSTTGDVYTNGVCQGTPSNNPPTISSVALTPTNAYAGDTLVCTASGANDIDGDVITFSYEWLVNGISSGNGATYNGAINGDTVNCMITPYDGISYGFAVSSNSITIQNTAPSISSVAIGYSTQQHTSGTFAGDQLTCTPSGGSDADGDALTYAYTWYLNGVSHSTTQNLDTTGMSSGDVVYCTVVANDGTDNSAAVNSASTTVYTIHNINIQNMAYSPSSITITQGDILIWTNLDSVDHTVTEDGTSNVYFNSGLISNGQTYTMTGLGVGTYNYYCQPHPSMTGTIIVQ